MKKLLFTLAAFLCLVAFSSCSSTKPLTDSDTEIAGYTLKNKKEIMAQKIVNKKSKKVLVTP